MRIAPRSTPPSPIGTADSAKQTSSSPETKNKLDPRTLAVWQPRTARRLSAEDARQITENVFGFVRTLIEWAKADEQHHARRLQSTASTGGPGFTS